MSKGSTFTPIGLETSKIISRILKNNSESSEKFKSYTKETKEMGNDNTPDFDWHLARQLNLFERATG